MTSSLAICIDPGSRPAYVIQDRSQLVERKMFAYRPSTPLVVGVYLAWESVILDFTPDLVICEGQHGSLAAKRRDSVLTLANFAGYQICRAHCRWGARVQLIHPQRTSRKNPPGWRDALRCAGVPKEIVQNRIEASLLPVEQHLFACASASRMGDCLDATGIGWGAHIAPPKDWTPPP